jgi:glycerophosphoryl diester phosphodiesterase
MAFELNPLRVGGKFSGCVLNIAHRGARAFAPENTLAAFEKAKTFGCPMFELDVHMSKDGELLVHHDDQLTRCTDVKAKFPGRSTYYVSDFTYDELSLLDAGSWYVEQLLLPATQRQRFLQTLSYEELDRFVSPQDRELYASGEIRIPTLNQVLELAQRSDMMVNIELKTLPRMYPGLADAVVDLIESMGFDSRILISSFDHEQLVRVRQRTNIIATGVLTSDRLANPGAYLRLLDADAYNPGCYGAYDSLGFNSLDRKLDPRGIINARSFGYRVNVWTCNDKDEMRQLITAGVTGLISDFPNRVRNVLDE